MQATGVDAKHWYDPTLIWGPANPTKVTRLFATAAEHTAIETLSMVQALMAVQALDLVLYKSTVKIVLQYLTVPIDDICNCLKCVAAR